MADLSVLRSVKQQRDALEAQYNEIIREAYRQGVSLRVIAEAAGTSHESIRRLVNS